MRLGPGAGGASAYKLKVPPPWMRRVGVRGILNVSPPPGLVGRLASVNAGTSLGFAATGYQCAEVAFDRCCARRSMLARLEGQATRGHGAGKEELAQRANEGFRPSCALLAHVAPPPSFGLGPSDPLRAQGVQLRARYSRCSWREGDVLQRTPITSKMVTLLSCGIGWRIPCEWMPLCPLCLPRWRRLGQLPLEPFDIQNFAHGLPPKFLWGVMLQKFRRVVNPHRRHTTGPSGDAPRSLE